MRHHNANRKFGLKANKRNALMKSLARSLVLKEKITTTEAKAKELRPYVEKLVTAGRENNVAARRSLSAKVGAEGGKKLVEVLGPKYKERKGGYTRITKLGSRNNDASPMAQIEFV
ncbi:MAG TPA: 50S ribosomal protein L17 [Candidatus Paceibacterota bacterium]|jgi:large subunit ribosomal protein L17|nr:50S ribosomal protein L17 [Candidatus Paceibacterota bacterium]